jgi:predicted enzyme related to lactoylglutathione lyase
MTNRGNFVWYELMTSDAQAAEDFYSNVVGWGAQDAGNPNMKYTLFTVDSKPVAGTMTIPEGCNTGVESMWSGYVTVDDVDQYASRVKDAGGKVTAEPQDIPNVGRFAVVADPQGAPFTLFKPSMDERGDFPKPPTAGTIGWHELLASDWKGAFEFYSGLFGWTKGETMDMGPMGTYQIIERDGEMFGAMMNNPEPASSPVWRYYICVDDITSAESRLKDKGGQVLFGPVQVPGDQWILHASDPQGIFFALVGAHA